MGFILSLLSTDICVLWKMIGDHQFYLSILLKLFKFAKYVCGIFSFRKINLRKAAEKH